MGAPNTTGPNFDNACASQYSYVINLGNRDAVVADGYTSGLSGASSTSYIFQQVPSGTYPNTVPNPSPALTALHEAGHAFDLVGSVTAIPLSRSLPPSPATPQQHWFLGDVGSDANYIGNRFTSDSAQQPFYFNYKPSYFAELFAEIFEMAISGHPTFGNSLGPIDYYYIHGNGLPVPDGMICSEVFVIKFMQNGTFPVDADYIPYGGSQRCFDNQKFPTPDRG